MFIYFLSQIQTSWDLDWFLIFFQKNNTKISQLANLQENPTDC